MKRHTFYITVFLLAFVFSVEFTKAYFSWKIQFRQKGGGGMIVLQDNFGRFAIFESFDGVKLRSSSTVFSLPESAHSVFQKTLLEAVEIVERKSIYQDAGKLIGERFVAKFPPNELAAEGYFSIIRLENDNIFEISSTSLRHAVAFENGAPR